MAPTLKRGAIITVDLRAYLHKRPALGDIVVFHPPRGADSAVPICAAPKEGGSFARPCGVSTRRPSKYTFVKRVVGLPGDRIKIVNGHVIRNGRRERDSYVTSCRGIPICNYRKPVVIPRNQYYTLGDNRGQSDDSRFWGPIHRSWLLGKVIAHTN